MFELKDFLHGEYFKWQRPETVLFNDDNLYTDEQWNQTPYNPYKIIVDADSISGLAKLKPLYKQLLANFSMKLSIKDTLRDIGVIGSDLANIHNRFLTAIKQIRKT